MDYGKKENKSPNKTNPNSNRNITATGTNLPSDMNSFLNNHMSAGAQPQYKNVREYAQALHCWLWQYRMLTAVGTFHSQMISYMPPTVGSQQAGPQVRPQVLPARPAPPRPQAGDTSPVNHMAGTQYKIPKLWRRVAAELLDFVLLFYAKILITVSVLRQIGYVNESVLSLEPQYDFLADITEMDFDKMFTLTTELIAVELLNRICVTIVETLCIQHGYAGSIGGATPGKKIMQLRVISYAQITDLRNRTILVVGERDPGFVSALVRSLIKNFSMAFFFPACCTVFFFKFNQAAYDVLTETVVVEVDRI